MTDPITKPPAAAPAAPNGIPAPAPDVQVHVRPRSDVQPGMYEITVRTNDHSGSSLTLTSPRDFAFRKSA